MKISSILCLLVTFCGLNASGVYATNSNSGFQFADIKPKGATVLHAENVIRSDKCWNLDLIKTTTSIYQESNLALNPCFAKAPTEQWPVDRHANVNYAKPPAGYQNGSAIAWAIAVNRDSNSGYVLLRALRVIGVDEKGTRHLVTDALICSTCANPDDKIWGYDMPKSLWRDTGAWDRPNHGTVFQVDGGVIKIPTSNQPFDLFHLWNAIYPRPIVKSGWSYYVEAEVLPIGSGMIQVGMDYWSLPQDGVNVQAAVSNWICSNSASNWITVRIGGGL